MKPLTRILFALLISSAISFNTSGQVTAGFTATSTSGCAPLVDTFTNTSTGATSYFWSFGTGTTSVLKDVTTSFLTSGTYTVTMTATGGGKSATATMIITVYPPPKVSFT